MPITAIIELATAITNAYLEFLKGATPEQKQQLVADFLEFQKFWRGLLPKP